MLSGLTPCSNHLSKQAEHQAPSSLILQSLKLLPPLQTLQQPTPPQDRMKTPQLSTLLLIAASTTPVFTLSISPIAEIESSKRAVLDTRAGNTASCTGTVTFPDATVQWYSWYIEADGPWVRNDWAQGFLDQLRGRCGAVLYWTYKEVNGVWAALFSTSYFIPSHCIEDSIWYASEKTGAIGGLQCRIRLEDDPN